MTAAPPGSETVREASSLARVVDLAHRRWTVPMLAQLHHARVSTDSTGARFVGLMHRLGVGRETLRQTLDYATAYGWVRRNPGHGHPLRPEFVLTERGIPVAAGCSRLWRAVVLSDLSEPLGRKWTAPILRVLGGGPARFGEFKATLSAHGLTDRALSQALRALEAGGLVSRCVTPARPPVVRYAAGERARVLLDAVSQL